MKGGSATPSSIPDVLKMIPRRTGGWWGGALQLHSPQIHGRSPYGARGHSPRRSKHRVVPSLRGFGGHFDEPGGREDASPGCRDVRKPEPPASRVSKSQ